MGSVQHQLGAKCVRAGIRQLEIPGEIQENLVGLLVILEQSDDHRLGPASSPGWQVGENGTLLGHEFDWNLERSVLHRRLAGLSRSLCFGKTSCTRTVE